LKLKHDVLLSTSAFKFKLRHYDTVSINATDAWPWNVRYAYTGVPWATPLVTGMVGGDEVPVDGGATVGTLKPKKYKTLQP
jgi:hypothetical protein